MECVSVIVPVYNDEHYLSRCLDSIICQTYSNLEIILIDDGSVDRSGSICDSYKKRDSRIVVIHKENGGLSSARNAGLRIASGKYLAFVDSDDWIDKDIYNHCIAIIKSTDCDVVDFSCVFTDGEPMEPYSNTHNKLEIIEGKEILRDYLLRGLIDKTPFSVCRKLYKRCLFDTIRFPDGKICEDIVTNYKVLMNCRRLTHTNQLGYYYFQDGISITRGGLKIKDFDLLDACEELQDLTQAEDYHDIRYFAKVKYARSYFSLLARIAMYGIVDDKLNRRETIRILTHNLRKQYFLLMSSPMPFNRKLMATALCINIRCLSVPIRIYSYCKRVNST